MSCSDILKLNLIERFWQHRPHEGNSRRRAINSHSKHRLEQQEHGSRGPGLRRASNRIGNGAFAFAAVKAAKKLRQTILGEDTHIEQGAENLNRIFLRAVAT